MTEKTSLIPLSLGMNPYQPLYVAGDLVWKGETGDFHSFEKGVALKQSDYTLFPFPATYPDEPPQYAFHHGMMGTLKLATRKVGKTHGLRYKLKTVAGQTYTVRYRLERERVLNDAETIPAPKAIVRVTADEKGKQLLKENLHQGKLSVTYQETITLTFQATGTTSYLFLLNENINAESGLSWINFQQLETDAPCPSSLGSLQVDPYQESKRQLTGTYTGPVQDASLFINGEVKSYGGSFQSDGTFTYYIAKGMIGPMDHVMLVGRGGNTIGERTILAVTAVPVVSEGAVQITGSYTGAEPFRAVLQVNGKQHSTGGTFNNGVFQYFVGKDVLRPEDEVSLLFLDAKGDTIVTQAVRVLWAQIFKAHYACKRATIEGAYQGKNVKLFKLSQETKEGNEEVLSWGGTLLEDENPKCFSYWVGASRFTPEDHLFLTPYDEKGNPLADRMPVMIEDATLTLAPYYQNDAELTGKYTGPIEGAYLYIGGQEKPVRQGGEFKDGMFRFYMGKLDLKAGPITLVPYNKSGDLLYPETQVMIRRGDLFPSAYGMGQSEIQGTFKGDIQLAKLQVNQDPQKVSWGGTFQDGTFSFYVRPGWITGLTDRVTLTGYSSSQEIIAGPVTVPLQIQARNQVPAISEIDLADVIREAQEAGKTTVYLKAASEVVYTVGARGASTLPRDVAVSLIGVKDAQNRPLSRVQMEYRDGGNQKTHYMLSFLQGIEDLLIEGIQFDLKQRGRGGLFFDQAKQIRIQHCQFGGYNFDIGHYPDDSNILLQECQKVWVENNRFFNNQGGTAEDELNRCVTVQEGYYRQSFSEHIYIRHNQFQSVCQGVVVSTDRMRDFQVHQNQFEAVRDNAIYALRLLRGWLTENTFNGLEDEAIVVGANRDIPAELTRDMVLDVVGNQAQNVKVKFVGLNGEMAELALLANQVTNEYHGMIDRPAALAYRRNTDAETIQRLLVCGNSFNLDTNPSDYDVFPLGSVTYAQFKENRITLASLAQLQKVFTFRGGMLQREILENGSLGDYLLDKAIPIDTLLLLRNVWKVREHGKLDQQAVLLRGWQSREEEYEKRWWKVPIGTLVMSGPAFPILKFQNENDYTYQSYF